jgi:cobalt-zinc-cadmium efflux system membrane fusion protein
VRTSFQQQVPALGTFVARPGGSATLRSPVAGEIVAPASGFLPPGSVVRAGDILGTVKALVGSSDRAALTEGRQQAANAVAEAKKAVALAERDAAQAANLGSGISDRERLEREQSVKVATAALSEAERAFAALGDGANVLVRAPVAGRIGSTLARPGDQVAAGDPLFRIVDAEALWVEARVPEHLAAGLVTGGPASVVATAFPDETLRGTILDAGQEADPATGSFTITVAVDGAGKDLHPGMSATAWVARGPPVEALVVPDDAVVDSNGMALGFVKVGPEQFELRELELGARSGESWEVLEGLEAGERVVVEGTYPLRSLAGR